MYISLIAVMYCIDHCVCMCVRVCYLVCFLFYHDTMFKQTTVQIRSFAIEYNNSGFYTQNFVTLTIKVRFEIGHCCMLGLLKK